MADDFDPQDLVAQQTAAESLKAARELEHQFEIDDLRWLLSSMRGRRIYCRQLEVTGLFQSGFHPDALPMAFAAGQRNVGLKLWADLHEASPDRYPLMMKERAEYVRRLASSRARS